MKFISGGSKVEKRKCVQLQLHGAKTQFLMSYRAVHSICLLALDEHCGVEVSRDLHLSIR
jgi:hypothetical protein